MKIAIPKFILDNRRDIRVVVYNVTVGFFYLSLFVILYHLIFQ